MKDLNHYLSLNYKKIVYKDDEGDYIVEVAELPGCMADGATLDEAFANLREAMSSWVTSRIEAGLSVPEPKEESTHSGKILVRMPKSLHKSLAEQAEVENVSLNQYIVSLLSNGAAAGFQAKELFTQRRFAPTTGRMAFNQGETF